MKTLKKTVCLLLCLMLVVLSASACKITDGQDEATGGETSRTDDATHSSGEPTTEQTTDPIKPTEDIFPISALKETKIVYRTGASEAVTGYADQLAKTIESVFGVKPAVGNDFLREGSDTFREYDYEILLGKINRDAGAGSRITDIRSTAIKFWYGVETSRRLERPCRILPMKW